VIDVRSYLHTERQAH